MGSLANAFAVLGDENDQEASTIVAVKTAEVKKVAEEHKKIVAEQKTIAEKKKKAEAKKKKKKNSGGQKSLDGNAQPNGRSDEVVSKESHIQTFKTLKEYEEQKALEKQQKALDQKQQMSEKSTLSVPETPLKEPTLDDSQTKQNSKNGPARGWGNEDSGKNMNNSSWAEYTKRNLDKKALPDDQDHKTVKVEAEAAAAPDLSENNFPVLGKVTKPTKRSV